jgi:hypothetical protein
VATEDDPLDFLSKAEEDILSEFVLNVKQK